MHVQRNIEERSHKQICSGKAVRITYSECVPVTLGIKQATYMRHVLLSSVALPALQYFITLSKNGTIFGEKKFLNK